jgi:ABC-type nitrate/sulfonate/bicarbonate transport system substrate-binding protein
MSKSDRPTASPGTLWYTRCSIPTPLGIAAQLNWYHNEFAADGLTVKSLQESQDPSEQASHFEHTLPHSFRLGGAVPPIWARARGQDTRVIGISWIDEYQVILSRPESGIRSAKDLKGRRLGLPKGASSRPTVDVARASALRAFIVALELVGLSDSDVEWVDVPTHRLDTKEEGVQAPDTAVRRRRPHSYTGVARALIKGDVDAIYVKDVRGAETAHLLGANVAVDLGFHPDPRVRINNCSPRPLTVNTATLREHPDLVRRFLNRVVAVGPWARQNPADAVAEIARETGWTQDWVRFAYGDKVHQHLDTNLSEASIAGLDEFKNFLLKWGFLQADFDVRSWIDPEPLEDLARRAHLKSA